MLKIGSRFLTVKTGKANIFNLEESIKKASILFKEKQGFMQFLSLDKVVSLKQLEFACEQTIYFSTQKNNFSKNLGLEFLARASGQKKLLKAIDFFAPTNKKINVAVVVFGTPIETKKAFNLAQKELDFRPGKKSFEKNLSENIIKIQKAYGFTNNQIKSIKTTNKQHAIELLILEKIALLGLEN